jgi:hypothetical protein
MMQAKRVEDHEHIDYESICYYKNKSDGNWYLYIRRMLGCLAAHNVTENPDGTITVSPSFPISFSILSQKFLSFFSY